MRRNVLLLFGMLLTGCPDSFLSKLDGGIGVIPILSTKPPNLDLAVLAAFGAERLLAETTNARVEIDPTTRDALTALGECADAIAYCYAPGASSIDQCFKATRVCETQRPWEEAGCCPATCRSAFHERVEAGDSERDAFEAVLFRNPDCFPGVRAALEYP